MAEVDTHCEWLQVEKTALEKLQKIDRKFAAASRAKTKGLAKKERSLTNLKIKKRKKEQLKVKREIENFELVAELVASSGSSRSGWVM